MPPPGNAMYREARRPIRLKGDPIVTARLVSCNSPAKMGQRHLSISARPNSFHSG